jgi:hypothetical protein
MDGRAFNDAFVVVTTWADGVRFNLVADIAWEERSGVAIGLCHLEPQLEIQPWTRC